MLEGICHYEDPQNIQQTLVMIKPDSWRLRSARPGAILGMFSRTGLRIIGCKVNRMSVAQALEFYGPVKDALCKKLAPIIGVRAHEILENKLGFKLNDDVDEALCDAVGKPYACDQFERIIEFMSGRRPSECPEAELEIPGNNPSLALVYEGPNAVEKIRNVLGPTDPTKAPDGTVRREFGSNVMVNTAHASDSPENAQREIGIVRMRESDIKTIAEMLKEENGL
jgi:nucleoside diphosphate kinase